MIQSFSDHAANERTFLAWVRTGIAVIALGFVIEKFNDCLRHADRAHRELQHLPRIRLTALDRRPRGQDQAPVR